MIYKLFTDGGARGNPGPGASSYVLFNENNELIWFDSKFIGSSATNNQAEYEAILMGLKYISRLGPKENDEIICHLDSELVVKQINGEYKVKNLELKKIYEQVIDLKQSKNIVFKHIAREYNKFADKLVNICLDSQNGNS